MPLDGREVTDATGRVHEAHEAIAHLGSEPRPMLVFPLLERPRRWNLEAIEEGAVDGHITVLQMQCIHINPAWRETDCPTLNYDRVTRDLGLDYRKPLGK